MAEEVKSQLPVNVSTTDANGKPLDNPVPTMVNPNESVGSPTIAAEARGLILNTNIDKTNHDLAHACDFILELQKSINFKKYAKALGNAIREGIRAIMKALGLSDPTGQYSWVIDQLKSIARWLKRVQKEVIQPINDFIKYVYAYITKLRAIITWILSLPDRLLALVKSCLQNLLFLIGNIFTDIAEGVAEGLSDEATAQVFKEVKATAEVAYDTAKQAAVTVAAAAAIPAAATVGLLVPASESDLADANKTIANYEKTVPSEQDSQIPAQEQNRSTP